MEKQIEVLKLALEAIKVNHSHHQYYDEYGGYDGSELSDMNIACIETLQEYINHLKAK